MTRRKRYTRNLGRTLKEPRPVRTTTEWIRFEHEREPYGVFSYLSHLRQTIANEYRGELAELTAWFRLNLDAPDNADDGRFWFCAEATEHVTRARRLSELARTAGIPIVERRTRRIPGKIRWEDRDQVAVWTYRDTPRPK